MLGRSWRTSRSLSRSLSLPLSLSLSLSRSLFLSRPRLSLSVVSLPLSLSSLSDLTLSLRKLSLSLSLLARSASEWRWSVVLSLSRSDRSLVTNPASLSLSLDLPCSGVMILWRSLGLSVSRLRSRSFRFWHLVSSFPLLALVPFVWMVSPCTTSEISTFVRFSLDSSNAEVARVTVGPLASGLWTEIVITLESRLKGSDVVRVGLLEAEIREIMLSLLSIYLSLSLVVDLISAAAALLLVMLMASVTLIGLIVLPVLVVSVLTVVAIDLLSIVLSGG